MRLSAILVGSVTLVAIAAGIIGIALFARGNREQVITARDRIETVCDAVKELNARDRVLIAAGAERFEPPLAERRIALALAQIPKDCVRGNLARLLRILRPGAITTEGDRPRRGETGARRLRDGLGGLSPRASPRNPSPRSSPRRRSGRGRTPQRIAQPPATPPSAPSTVPDPGPPPESPPPADPPPSPTVTERVCTLVDRIANVC